MAGLGRARGALVTIAVVCTTAFTVGVPTASAQPVQRSHDRSTVTLHPQEVCGIDGVILTLESVDNFMQRLGRNGFPLFQSNGRATGTYTNPATNLSVIYTFAGVLFKDLSVTDNGDGTITVRTATTGIPEQLTLPDGTVAIKDVGRVVVATVLNYNGTPADPNDDVPISQSIESVSGPHPDLESGYSLLCPAIIDGLT